MADIHVYSKTGDEVVYPENRLSELLEQGKLPPDGYYWREGMSDWQPLRNYRAATNSFVPERRTDQLPDPASRPAAQEPPAPRQPGGRTYTGRYFFRRRPHTLTTAVQVVVVLCCCLVLAEVVAAAIRLHLLQNEASGDGSIAANEQLTQELTWGGVGMNVVLLVLYCLWIYRAALNCRTFSSMFNLTPRWVVGCHFIPLMNLFRPLQAMQDIWKVSTQPRTWQQESPSFLVTTWWLLWLLVVALAETSYLLTQAAHTRGDMVNATLVYLFWKLVQLGWYGAFVAVVRGVINRQRLLVETSRERTRSK